MIAKNDVIEWFDDNSDEARLERVLWIAPDKSYLYAFDIINWETALPIRREYADVQRALTEGDADLKTFDDEYLSLPESSYTAEQRKNRDKDMSNIIEPLISAEGGEAIFIPKKRGFLIDDISKRFPSRNGIAKAKRIIYRKLRLFWRGGQVANALIPRQDKAGVRGIPEVNKPEDPKRGFRRKHSTHPGMNIDQRTKKLLLKGYKRFYVNGKCKTLTAALQKTLETYFSTGQTVTMDGVTKPELPHRDKLPTMGQFRYHCHRERDRLQVLASREGENRANANHGPTRGSAALMAFGSGDWYFLDSTPGDCIIVSPYDPNQELGKATIYFVKDLFSFLIVGYLVTLEEESWLAELLAFQTVVMDKVALCAKYFIQITPEEWPCHHLPGFVYDDRGPGESENASNYVNNLGVQISNAPPRRPDKKGPVELDFSLANQYAIHVAEGGGPPPEARGAKDHRGLPCVTLDALNYIVLSYIKFYNNFHMLDEYPLDEFMIRDKVDPVPVKLWNWGIKNRSGLLRTMDPDVVYRNLLPRVQARVTPKGLGYKDLYFYSEYGEKKQWYLKAGRKNKKKQAKVIIAYDPRTTNFVFLCNKKGMVIEKCSLAPRSQGYANISWKEYEAQKNWEAERRNELENDKMQGLVELNARIAHVSEPALQKALTEREQAGLPKKPTAKKRRENKAKEREERRRVDTQEVTEKPVFTLAALETPPVTEMLPKDRRPNYVPPPSFDDEEGDHA